MLKRHCSSENQTKKGHWSRVELVPDDIVELILERLPVDSLLRFKCVSKKWKSTIESRRFQETQLIRRQQSRGPDLLCVSLCVGLCDGEDPFPSGEIELWSSECGTVRLSTPYTMICHGSCDGLICIYCVFTPSIVVNPATRWQQSFPLSNIQQFIVDKLDKGEYDFPYPMLGFGKEKLRGIYKPVWLYNSSDYGFDNVTTCEVFDFSTNTWRYIHPASPYRVNDPYHNPVYLDGSLHWLTTAGEKSKVLSFDLHTETFQVICNTPFSNERYSSMSILDDRLCVSKIKGSIQVIWLLDSSNSNKTWKKLYSIDLTDYYSWFVPFNFPLAPIRILDKNKLLLQGLNSLGNPVMHDIEAQSNDLQSNTRGHHVYYFPSLLSVLSN